MTDLTPRPKVIGAGVGGALGIVLAWAAEQVGIPMSEEVAAALATLLAFMVGYAVPERAVG